MMEDWPKERLIKQSEMIQKYSSEKAVKKQMKEVKISIVGKGKEICVNLSNYLHQDCLSRNSYADTKDHFFLDLSAIRTQAERAKFWRTAYRL